MAAMGKVLMRERAEVVSVLSAAFPILTFLFRLIDFSGTMKKVRPHSPFCTWKIMRSDGGGGSEDPPVGLALKVPSAQIGAEETPGWGQLAMLTFLALPPGQAASPGSGQKKK